MGLTTERIAKDMSGLWRQYKETGLLNNSAFSTITKYTATPEASARAALLETDTATVEVFKQLLAFHDTEVLEYMLALVDQALSEKPGLGAKFESSLFLSVLKQAIAASQDVSYASKPDEDKGSIKFILWKSCRVLAHIHTVILSDAEGETGLSEFLSVLLNDMYGTSKEALLVCFMQVLKKPSVRKCFVAQNGIVKLQQMLGADDATVQSQYQAINCLWLLSFQAELHLELGSVIPKVIEVSRNCQKEKVMRISLMFLRNLTAETKNVERMVENKLHKQLEIWCQKQWGDEDVVADLTALNEIVASIIAEMSSFERFRAEVLSGDLEWTPVHSSEIFWRDNIASFSQDDFKLVRVLSELLNNRNTKPTTKAVACYDIGEFVRLHPAGRRVVTDLGTKKTIMGLLYDVTTETEVQKQALLCTRKMMVKNWEMLK